MNHCTFEGRLSAEPELRSLPSGDTLVTFRIIVERERAAGVDTIDCQVDTIALRRRVSRLEPGVRLHVEGRLQRRFFRTPAGISSRYAVHVTSLRRIPTQRAA